MKLKKTLAILLALLTVVSSTACSSPSPTPPAAAPVGEAAESIEAGKLADLGGSGDIHIAAWTDAADSLNAIAEKFNAQTGHTGKVIIDEADGRYTKLKPALQANAGVPDIFQTQNYDTLSFLGSYGNDPFLDLTDVISPEIDNFVPSALVNCISEDGSYRSLPWDIGPVAMIYRTDIFKDAGIDAASLTTYDKYIEAGKTLQAKNKDYYIDAYNFNGSSDMTQFSIFFNQLGGQYFNAEGKVDLASEQMLKATDLILKMVNEGVAMDIPNAWEDRIAAINSDKLVSLIYPVWFLGTMKSACADLSGKWALAPMPAFEEGGNNMATSGGSTMSVYADTKNPQLCIDFLKFALMSDEGNDINMAHGLFPSYTPSYETDAFNAPDDYVGGQSIGAFFHSLTNAPEIHFNTGYSNIARAVLGASGNILNNKMDPKEAWAAATEEAQRNIDIG